MRTLVVAMTPAGPGPRRAALEGSRTKARVDAMIGLDLYTVSTVRNLLPEYTSPWDARAAQREAWVLLTTAPLADYARCLLLGSVVRDAFAAWVPELRGAWFTTGVFAGVEYTTSPHPSGRSRWWNDEANRRSAERFYARYFRSQVVQ